MRNAPQMLVAALGEVAPDLSRFVVEFGFGDIHCRPGLDSSPGEIATIAAYGARHCGPATRAHIHAAPIGALKKKSSKSSSQMALYAGFPATINGMQAAKRVFMERTGKK